MNDFENIRPQLQEDIHETIVFSVNAAQPETEPINDRSTKSMTIVDRAGETIRLNREAVAHAEAFLVRSRAFREASEERVARITRRLRLAGYNV
jgi:hypothetical protein